MDPLHRATVEDLLFRVKMNRYRLLITYPKAAECSDLLRSVVSEVAKAHKGSDETALLEMWEEITPRNRGQLKESAAKQTQLVERMVRSYAQRCQELSGKSFEEEETSESEESFEAEGTSESEEMPRSEESAEDSEEDLSFVVPDPKRRRIDLTMYVSSDSDSSVEIISPPRRRHKVNRSVSPDVDTLRGQEEEEEEEEGVQFGELIVDGEFADYYATSATQFRMEFSLLTDATRSHRLLSRYFVDSCAPRDPPKEVSLVVAAYVDKLFDSTSAECPSIEGDVEDIVYVGGYNMAAFRQEMPTSGRHLRAESLDELMDVLLQYKPRKKSLDVFVEVTEDLRRREVNAERHAEIFVWIVGFFAAAHPEVHVVVLAPLHEDTRRLSFDTTVNYFEKLKQLRTLKNVSVLYSQSYVKKMSALMDDEGRLNSVTAVSKAFRLIKKEMK
ncbi:hypothetical protein QR680_007752 [Steinernema hermaphroditum]|uniref:Uncharacterized protein n=1 Tax=Steinernema hermaphroditum TaxID=289476 RepID=A0AA39IE70_9BILA|nr:hypothetical protein QR680_007752 [Steinernema hermaphroditum]